MTNATIELLRTEADGLRQQVAELRETRPDVLAEQLSRRIQIQAEEIQRMAADSESDAALLAEKESELRRAFSELDDLRSKMQYAGEVLGELFCPHCAAVMVERAFHYETVGYQGRELEVDHEVVVYECGREIHDGEVRRECGQLERGARRPGGA